MRARALAAIWGDLGGDGGALASLRTCACLPCGRWQAAVPGSWRGDRARRGAACAALDAEAAADPGAGLGPDTCRQRSLRGPAQQGPTLRVLQRGSQAAAAHELGDQQQQVALRASGAGSFGGAFHKMAGTVLSAALSPPASPAVTSERVYCGLSSSHCMLCTQAGLAHLEGDAQQRQHTRVAAVPHERRFLPYCVRVHPWMQLKDLAGQDAGYKCGTGVVLGLVIPRGALAV